MSSLKQPKDTRKQTTVSLKGAVLADLELYCQFIDSARDWVINEALKSVFSKDKAFLEWKERASNRELNGNGFAHAMPPVDKPANGRPLRSGVPVAETNKNA